MAMLANQTNKSNPPALPACLVDWGLMVKCLFVLLLLRRDSQSSSCFASLKNTRVYIIHSICTEVVSAIRFCQCKSQGIKQMQKTMHHMKQQRKRVYPTILIFTTKFVSAVPCSVCFRELLKHKRNMYSPNL